MGSTMRCCSAAVECPGMGKTGLNFRRVRAFATCVVVLCLLSGTTAAIATPALRLVDTEWLRGSVSEGLRVRLALELSGEPLQALEQGVALPFRLQWRRCEPGCGDVLGEQRIEMRHAPLLQRYMLQFDDSPPRQFPFRAALLGAFEQPPVLPLAPAAGWQVRVRLWREGLPAPLRLPALLRDSWQLDTDWQAVP